MRFNPCGHICEYGRRPYSTACRFWEDSDETSEIIWYVADEDAPVLPYESVFNSLDMEKRPWERTGPGEVFDAPRVYNARWTPPVLGQGQHICGTFLDFRWGGVLNSDPPAPYDPQGIPLCCNPPVIGTGGAGCSGTAIVTTGWVPGPSCVAATIFPIETTQFVELVMAVASVWAKIPVTTGLHLGGGKFDVAPGLNIRLYEGADCSSLTTLGLLIGDGTWDVFMTANDFFWIEFLANPFATVSTNFSVGVLP